MPEHTISENLERLVQAKNAIASAITDMGGTVNQGDGFEEFPADIRTISGGSSDFTATLTVTTGVPGCQATATKTGKMFTATANNSGVATLTITSPGSYSVGALMDGYQSSTTTTSIMTHQQSYSATVNFTKVLLTAPSDSTVTMTSGSTTVTTTGTGSEQIVLLPASGTYSVSADRNSYHTEGTFTVASYATAALSIQFVTIALMALEDASVEIMSLDGQTSITGTATGNVDRFELPGLDTWTITTTLEEDVRTTTVEADEYETYVVKLSDVTVYGASWSGGESPVLTRTDGAANFNSPDPYVADGNHPGYSPFDNVLPWAGIERVTIDGNALVKIPKFWFKVTKTGDTMTFQIADGPTEGFHVSPAHADRGDGVGERDFVYVGRYHCNASYGSTTGVTPKVSITRATARTGCHALGSDYWLSDFAMFWTTRLLYIVEMGNFDSQAVIGYGRGNNSSAVAMGYTDSMPYHTGTMAANRTTYGANTQYRYMEGLWDNIVDWCDGIGFSGSSVYAHNTPSEYNDSRTNYTLVGTRPTTSSCIKSMFVPTAEGYEYAMYPSEVVSDSTYTKYLADGCYYYSSGVVLYVGGDWYQNRRGGMFYLSGDSSASSANANIGARLQYLPG